MDSYPVNLSIIGSLQQNCEAFFWSFFEKPQKTRFWTTFDPKRKVFPNRVASFIIGTPFQPNGQLSCKFEHHRITTAKLRSVFLEFHRKTPKKPVFSTIFGPKHNFFFLITVAFFIFGTPSTTKWTAIL